MPVNCIVQQKVENFRLCDTMHCETYGSFSDDNKKHSKNADLCHG